MPEGGSMTRVHIAVPTATVLTATVLIAAALVGLPGVVPAQGATTVLAPHRAVYDLTLTRSRGKRPVDVSAKIVFPTEHMLLNIDAAKEGKTLLELKLYVV
jgi:hypothetical protein